MKQDSADGLCADWDTRDRSERCVSRARPGDGQGARLVRTLSRLRASRRATTPVSAYAARTGETRAAARTDLHIRQMASRPAAHLYPLHGEFAAACLRSAGQTVAHSRRP